MYQELVPAVDSREGNRVSREKDNLPFEFCLMCTYLSMVYPGGSVGKESACNAGDPGSIPGWGRSPGGEKGNPLQYSCLENSMDRRAGGQKSMGSERLT